MYSVRYHCDNCGRVFYKEFPQRTSAPATIYCIYCNRWTASSCQTTGKDTSSSMKPREWIKWFRRRESLKGGQESKDEHKDESRR